ncbi:MAG: hypothetical protein ACR2QJ_12365 [Geminicoccaceae bacterium]
MDQAIGNTANQLGDAPSVPAEPAARPEEQSFGARDDGPGMASKRLYAGREWSTGHPLNIRVSIPIGFGRYYAAIVAGKERRARARLALDRRLNPLDTPGNVLFIAFVATIATAGCIAIFYLLLAHLFGWTGRLFL